jgi:hypothetical protein
MQQAAGSVDVQMYGDSPGAQVRDAEDTTNHISSQVVKDKNLPDGFAVGIEDRSGFGDEAVGEGGIVLCVCAFGRGVVEVEDLFDGRWRGQYAHLLAERRGSRTHLAVAKGVVLGCHVDRRARSFSRTDGRYCIQGWADL